MKKVIAAVGLLAVTFALQAVPASAEPKPKRYANCTAARAAGVTPIVKSENAKLYAINSHMDRDKDGVACE